MTPQAALTQDINVRVPPQWRRCTMAKRGCAQSQVLRVWPVAYFLRARRLVVRAFFVTLG